MRSLIGPLDLVAIVSVCVVVVLFLRSRNKNLTLSLGDMHATLETVSAQVKAVDVAVNERAPGMATMSEDVTAAKLSLADLQEYVVYQHDANYKLVNMLTPLVGLLPLILTRLEAIAAAVTKENGG